MNRLDLSSAGLPSSGNQATARRCRPARGQHCPHQRRQCPTRCTPGEGHPLCGDSCTTMWRSAHCGCCG